MVKYSVIVPVYNVEKYLNKCIDSILAQTIKDFELILVDDGSKDKSGEICDQYIVLDSRVKVIHKENGGVSSARNKGIEYAIGEYIVFIDSDDYVENNYLETFDNAESVDLVISSYILEDETFNVILNKNINEKLFKTSEIDKIREYFVNGAFNYSPMKRFKRSIIYKNDLYFNVNFNLSEDTLFNIQYIKFCDTIKILNIPTYHYVKYSHNTLSNASLSIDLINKIENVNSVIHDELCCFFHENTKNVIVSRISLLYRNFINEMINNNVDFNVINHFMKQKWFKLCLDNENFLKDENKKFRLLMKFKSSILLWLYIRFLR